MGKPKTPSTPNPIAVSGAQSAANIDTANANSIISNGNVTNADGSRTTTFDQVPVWNSLTKEFQNVSRPNVVETLSQGQQRIYDANQASEYSLAQYGNQQSAELLKRGASPFSYNTGEHEKWSGDLYNKLNAETNASNEEALRTRLSNQGFKVGSSAYDKEMSGYAKGRDNARNQFLLDSQQQGFSQALAARNQQTNEPLAIASGTQIQMPNFTGASGGSVANTDYAANVWNAYNADVNKANQRSSNIGGVLSGIGGLFAMSDENEKKDIKKLGIMNGQEIHEYRMKGEGAKAPKRLGLIAQKVQKKMPEAVMRGRDGKLRVNYGMALGGAV